METDDLMDDSSPAVISNEFNYCLSCNVTHEGSCPLFSGDLEGAEEQQQHNLPPVGLSLLTDESGGVSVIADTSIGTGTEFGPLAATFINDTQLEGADGLIPFPIKLFLCKGITLIADTTDTSVCNWMCSVKPGHGLSHSNMVVYQRDSLIYFKSIRPISPGYELIVWYEPEYEQRINNSRISTGLHPSDTVQQLPIEIIVLDRENQSNPHDGALAPPNFILTNVNQPLVTVVSASGSSIFDNGQPTTIIETTTVPVDTPSCLHCGECAKVFTNTHKLYKHLHKHLRLLKKLHALALRRKLRCTICNKKYESQIMLAAHIRRHKNKYNCLRCFICYKIFKQNQNLVAHMRQHSRWRNFHCHKCQRCFGSEELLNLHSAMHRGGIRMNGPGRTRTPRARVSKTTEFYPCTSCQKLFITESRLKIHLHKFHPYVCLYCNEQFHSLDETTQHYGDFHSDEPNYSQEVGLLRLKVENMKAKTCYVCQQYFPKTKELENHLRAGHGHGSDLKCPRCMRVYKRFSTLKCHMQLHEDLVACNICYRLCTPTRLTMHKHQSHAPKTHQCHLCGLKFSSTIRLKAHIRIVHEEKGNHVCEICLKVLSSRHNLLRHLKTHCQEWRHTCSICTRTFKLYDTYQLHLATHLETMNSVDYPIESAFPCQFCSRLFSKKSTLRNHLLTHTGNFICRFCLRVFHRKDTLNEHLLSKHYDMLEVSDPLLEMVRVCEACGIRCVSQFKYKKHLKTHTFDRFDCNACGKFFQIKKNLMDHACDGLGGQIRDPGKFQCDNCDERFHSVSLLNTHLLQQHGISIFTCLFCDKRFSSELALIRHMVTHAVRQRHDNEPIPCPKCDQPTESVSQLSDHMITVHKIKCFICETCGKTFFAQKNMDTHQLLHSADTNELRALAHFHRRCEECGDEFTNLSDYDKHKVSHSGRRTFNCGYCEKKFKRKDYLQNHYKTHSDDRNFLCYVCGKAVKTKASLHVHMKKHTDKAEYNCSVCGRSFYQQGNLKKHLLTHTTARGFQCPVCNKLYKRKETLKSHMLVHNDPQEFICSVCKKRYATLYLLKKHMDQTHLQMEVSECPICHTSLKRHGALRRHIRRKHPHIKLERGQKVIYDKPLGTTDEVASSGDVGDPPSNTTGDVLLGESTDQDYILFTTSEPGGDGETYLQLISTTQQQQQQQPTEGEMMGECYNSAEQPTQQQQHTLVQLGDQVYEAVMSCATDGGGGGVEDTSSSNSSSNRLTISLDPNNTDEQTHTQYIEVAVIGDIQAGEGGS